MKTLPDLPLPAGIRSRQVPDVNGLSMHVLEAGFASDASRPCLLLLHGFPELAFSWRKIMLPLAAAGYHVIAPDQRGYGRTTGWTADPGRDASASHMIALTGDVLALLAALGKSKVEAVIGHDFGSPVAAWCALSRPDIFGSVVLMSAPFAGPPAWPVGTLAERQAAPDGFTQLEQAVAGLGTLTPARQHYQWFYSGNRANDDMLHCPQGLHDFLRAYYHVKSADWQPNRPYPLGTMSTAALAQLPRYYVMDADKGMAETVAAEMPGPETIAACAWLPDAELAIYSAEYARTGFQGGLDWYRCGIDRRHVDTLRLFGGKTIDIPSCFIAGRSDWGVYQMPGAFEKMQHSVCTQMLGCHLIDGAGHWVQQEQPVAVLQHLLHFLGRHKV